MTTTNAPDQNGHQPGTTQRQAGTLPNIRQVTTRHQWAALTKAEVKLLVRNAVQITYALVFPLLMPLLFLNLNKGDSLPDGLRDIFGSITLTASIIIGCTLAAYYTPVSALVNRREEAVLQRMRAGEARELTILAAIFTPGAVLAALTGCGIFFIVHYLVGFPLTTHMWLTVVGLLVAILVCVGFAMVTANYTRTAESAQVTTVPFIMIAILGSMATFVPKEFSTTLYYLVNIVPTAPAAVLIDQGVAPAPDWAEVSRALAAGAAWIIFSLIYGWSRLRWAKRI